jgi:agmatine/peptidylarginine deiminase
VATLAERGRFRQAQRERIDFALEGGAIETDGAGTLLSTWRCLHERHPDLSRADVTARLQAWLHQDRTLWLEHGYLEGDDTDAHIDTLARFAGPDAIVYQGCQDATDAHHAELQAMAAELAAFRRTDGSPYRLFELPWPQPIVDEGRRLAASYANFLIVNGAVLMPAYGDAADAEAARVLASAFPGREIVPVNCRPLIWQNGSLHCLTMQLPEGLLA